MTNKYQFNNLFNYLNRKSRLAFIGVVILLGCSYSGLMFFGNREYNPLTTEDGFFETLTAILFLISSALFLITFWTSKGRGRNDFYFFKTNRNYFFLLLGIVFFMGFGEEISWGQRVLNIETPEVVKEINMQNELNIHNLMWFHGRDTEGNMKSFSAKIFNIDRLFSLFWFSFCFMVPILNICWAKFAKAINRIGLPVVPLWLGSAFLANYIISKILEFVAIHGLTGSIVEVKECNFAFLFCLLGAYFVQFNKSYSD